MYSSEKKLVEQFVRLLDSQKNPWGPLSVLCEFFYARGKADVVALTDGDVLIAFEAKLKDWRYASTRRIEIPASPTDPTSSYPNPRQWPRSRTSQNSGGGA